MTMHCPDCLFYNLPDTTCRRNAPTPAIVTGNAVPVWPAVKATDWCADGYNPIDGWYNKTQGQPSVVTPQRIPGKKP